MKMLLTLLLTTLGLLVQGSTQGTILTQTPGSQSVVPGQTVSFRCKVSPNPYYCFNWYFQKPGESPKLLIYCTNSRHSGISDRFTGTSSGNTDFTLTISGVQAEDAGIYYCQTGHYINSKATLTQ
ncbi:hypothetical protein ATANTOWER_013499 [Ataeniobius toweri]|uniref:Ig-like domain-containing protein n=1 Tax=Ataeniobius toweri TaxID=208326 RepID=A0ABU7AZI5_9TELE|nr:hypothetical protein [Ataeniobius toweri]